MLRFLPGVVLIQIISMVIFWVNLDTTVQWNLELLLKIGLPLLLLGTTTALWFDSVAKSSAANAIAKLKDAHAKEREKLQIKTEREKTKVITEAHKEINKQARRVSGKANFKVGLAFMGAAGAGLLMLLTELITFGMITLMTAGGALGGYLFRARREIPTYADALPMADQGSPIRTKIQGPRIINESDSEVVATVQSKKTAIRSSDR